MPGLMGGYYRLMAGLKVKLFLHTLINTKSLLLEVVYFLYVTNHTILIHNSGLVSIS